MSIDRGPDLTGMLISVGAAGVTFARPADTLGGVLAVEEIRAGATATFTDAVTGYAARQGVPLHGCPLTMSVAGAMTGGTLRTTSGKWFVSVDGLHAMTGIRPTVVNDVVAMAWSTTVGEHGPSFGGSGAAPTAASRRRCLVFADTQGLGAACVADGRERHDIFDSEAGHMPFAAATDAEHELVRKVAKLYGVATYENVVAFAASGTADQSDRQGAAAALDLLATILGRYAASVTLAFAAWQGAIMCGSLFEQIRTSGRTATFRDSFEGAGKMRTILRTVPTSTAPNGTSALRGLSVLATAERPASVS